MKYTCVEILVFQQHFSAQKGLFFTFSAGFSSCRGRRDEYDAIQMLEQFFNWYYLRKLGCSVISPIDRFQKSNQVSFGQLQTGILSS